jgi:hypothetical protein
MDAKNIFIDKENAFIYLERYVNDGSPSGFHMRSTSQKTNPFTGEDKFPLLEFCDDNIENIFLGKKHSIFEKGINYAHPDSINSENLIGASRKITESKILVSPTAGGRTMFIRSSEYDGFIKLTYDTTRLGRVDRQLTLKHCQSSIEVSKAMKDCIDNGKFPETFSLLLEESAKVSLLKMQDKTYEWGSIYREAKPYPYLKKNTILVPGFSLFGKDKFNGKDEFLINQFIELSNSNPKEYLINVLKIIVDSYWAVVLNCAFHIECHAQNCMFEVDEDYNILRIVIKDMDSVDKDIPLAKHFGLKTDWESCPYMCFDGSIYFYSIRPSFIYDFKVGEYLLSKIIEAVTQKYKINKLEIENIVKTHVRENYIWQLPNNYFPPDGCWYNCDTTERKPGEKRKYFANNNPKFR